ncbi:DUF3450 family protein [Coraliomargarita sp. W4R72]
MRNLILFGIGFAVSFATGYSQNDIANTREVLNQWVETEQIISETRSGWALEKAMLQDSKKLLASELERLNAELEALDATATAVDEERTELAANQETLSEASAVVESNIGDLEAQIKTILPRLPVPLIDRIKPLVRRLPDDPNNTQLALGERVQNIVGILSQADKFNGTITQTSESREVGDGRVIEVRTLYWGLGGAFYVDTAGEYAGVGFPGESGWEWPTVDGSGGQIKRLFDVYEGAEDIQFVEVPVRIK